MPKSRLAALSAALMLVCCALARAQPPRDAPIALLPPIEAVATPAAANTWTLVALVQRAEASHPELEQAGRDVDAAQGRAVQAGLYPNPMLAGSSPQLAGSISQYNTFTSQEVVTMHKLTLAQSAALREVEQYRFRYQSTRLRIVAAVRREFYSMLVIQRRLVLQQQLAAIVMRSRDTARLLLEGGEGTKADVLLLDIDYDRALMAVRNLQTELEVARRRLAFAVGFPGLPIGQVEGNLNVAIPPANLDSLRQYVANTHPEMSVARLETGRSQFLLRRAEVQPIPNLNLMGGYQRQVDPPVQNQALFQVMVEVPLFNRNQGNIRAAQAHVARASAGVRTAELDLSQRVAIAYNDFTVATQRIDVYERQLRPKAQETFQIARELYEQGLGHIDFFRLFQSQRTLIDIELGYLDVLEARMLAAADLAALSQWNDFPDSPPPAP